MIYALIQIDQKQLERFKTIEQEFAIEKITVDNDQQYRNLSELLKKVKTREKEIQEVFREPKQLAYKNHREIVKVEKQYLDHLRQFEEKAKEAIGKYLVMKESQNTVLNPIDIPKVKGIVTYDVWKWEVEDIDKVPFEVGNTKLFRLDEKAIDMLVKSSDGTIKIPGIRIYKEKTVAVRTDD